MENEIEKERFFRLTHDFKHPLKTFEQGSTYTATTWAIILGSNMTEKEFIEFYESRPLFRRWFKEE